MVKVIIQRKIVSGETILSGYTHTQALTHEYIDYRTQFTHTKRQQRVEAEEDSNAERGKKWQVCCFGKGNDIQCLYKVTCVNQTLT